MSGFSRLPPLNALRAFEAAARYNSFAKAAEELNVTAAAVSHQVKSLEETVGIELFVRHARGLEVTDAGRAAQPLVAEGFDRLVEGVQRMRQRTMPGQLLLSVVPSFAIWLVSRMEQFEQLNPGVETLLDATTKLVDLERSSADIGIRYGAGQYPGLHVTRLLQEREFPVCSPDYLKKAPPLRRPDDLKNHTLLHTDWWGEQEPWPTWKMWLKVAGVSDVDWTKGPRFSAAHLACQAARDGNGIALGTMTIVKNDLEHGYLVRPFEIEIGGPENLGIFFVCAENRKDEPDIAAFREWLLAELVESFGADQVYQRDVGK